MWLPAAARPPACLHVSLFTFQLLGFYLRFLFVHHLCLYFTRCAGILNKLICEGKKKEKSIFSRNQLGGGEGRKFTHAAGCRSELVGGEHRRQVFSNKPWRSCLMSWAVFVPSHMTSIPASIYLNLKSQQDGKRVKQKHSIGFTASFTEVSHKTSQRSEVKVSHKTTVSLNAEGIHCMA